MTDTHNERTIDTWSAIQQITDPAELGDRRNTMIGYIYNDRDQIICEIHGETNTDIEAMAEDLNYMGVDGYALTYTPGDMIYTAGWDKQVTDK